MEKSSRVLLCNNSKTKSNFDSNIKQLKTTLSETKTLPSLQAAILKILQNWRYGRTINICEFTNENGIRDAFQDQSTIGWNNFILGRWSQRWQLVQQRFIKQTDSKRSSLRWTTSIINKLLYVVWDIWNFRNSLVHGKGGINDKAAHKELNFQIRQQFTIGFQNLLLRDRRIYLRSSITHLIDSPRATKQNWIRNLNAARMSANPSDENEEEAIPQHTQTLMEDFIENFEIATV